MRDWLKPDRIEDGSRILRELAAILDSAAGEMRKAGVPFLLLHGEDRIVDIDTKLRKWAEKLLKDVQTDAPLFAKSETTNAEKEVFRHHGGLPSRPDIKEGARAKKVKKA